MTEDGVVTESGAIMLHLCDCHPDVGFLAPVGSLKRANTYQWMSFLATNIYDAVLRSEYSDRYTDGGDSNAVKAAAHRDVDHYWGIVEQALTPGPLLFGTELSVADIYLAMLSCWHHDSKVLYVTCPKVKRALDAVLSRPSIREVFVGNALV